MDPPCDAERDEAQGRGAQAGQEWQHPAAD
jgi:hypothetical protein